MALSINLTLFIQIFHFLIAYWFISRTFLRPVYGTLILEQKKLGKLRSQVVKEQNALAVRQEHISAEWQSCKDYFQAQKPLMSDSQPIVPKDISHIEPIKKLTIQERGMLVHEITSVLKAKVLHD